MTRVPEGHPLPTAETGVVPLRWSALGVALAATTLGLIGLWRLSPPFYWTNDDVWARRLVEGTQFPGEPPTGFLGYAHAGLGWLAVALQLVLRRQQRVPVHDHHGLELQQPRLARQANRANQLHEYPHRQEYHRDKLFSVSIVCSAR